MQNLSCIYQIKNIETGKCYVGSAINFRKRCHQHKSDLKNNKHHSIALQRAWDKYGEKFFLFSIIEIVEEKNNLLIREQHWIDMLDVVAPNGYNIAPKAGSNLGRKFSAEARANMSASKIGFKHTHESKIKISEAGKRPCSDGTRLKIGLGNKGKIRSEKERARLSEKAKNMTLETRAKIGASSKGRIYSAESIKKMSDFQKGRKKSDDHKKKIGFSNKGKVRSEEAKKKVSDSKTGVPWSEARRLSYLKKYGKKLLQMEFKFA